MRARVAIGLLLVLVGATAGVPWMPVLEAEIPLYDDEYDWLDECEAACVNTCDGTVWFANGWGSTVVVYDHEQKRLVAEVTVGQDPKGLLYDSELDRVYCANTGYVWWSDRTVSIVDATGRRVTATLEVGAGPRYMFLHPTSRKLYVSCIYGAEVAVIDTRTELVVAHIPVDSSPGRLCWNPLTDRLYCPHDRITDSMVTVIDCTADTALGRIPVGSRPAELCVFGPANLIYCATAVGLLVIDGVTDSVVGPVAGLPRIETVASADAFGKVYAGYADTVAAIDGATRVVLSRQQVLGRVEPDPPLVARVRFLPGADRVCITGWDEDWLYYGGVALLDCRADTFTCEVSGPACDPIVYDSMRQRLYCPDPFDPAFLVLNTRTERASDWVADPAEIDPSGMLFDHLSGRVYCYGEEYGSYPAFDCRTLRPAGWPLTSYCVRRPSWCIDPVNNLIFLSGEGGLHVLDGPSGELVRQVPERWTDALAWCADDSLVYTNCTARLEARDPVDFQVRFEVDVTSRVSWIASAPGSGRIVCAGSNRASGEQQVEIVDIFRREVVGTFPLGGEPVAFGYDSLRGLMFCATTGEDRLEAFDCRSVEHVATSLLQQPCRELLCVPWAGRVYLSDGRLLVLDPADLHARAVFEFEEEVGPLCYSPSSSRLYCGVGGQLAGVDVLTGSVVGEIDVGSELEALAWFPDSNRIVALDLWDECLYVLRDMLLPPARHGVEQAGPKTRPATLVRSMLTLPGREPAVLLDISGREVLDLQPGENDVRHLSPGVYFVREKGPRGQGFDGPSRKVVLTH